MLNNALFLSLYEPLHRLGVGGMGEVYQVRHRSWNVVLAMKILSEDALRSFGGLERFCQEANLWVSLDPHPCVVTCYYVRVFDGSPALFAEYVPGGSLQEAILTGELKHGAKEDPQLRRALQIILDVSYGVEHAHQAGIIHQDIKPSNILLGESRAKLSDFGVAGAARKLTPVTATSTTPNTIAATAFGMTVRYASPEQLYALTPEERASPEERYLSRKSDIWSLGCTLLETILGGATWSQGTEASDILQRRAAEVGALYPLLSKMLEPLPAKRATIQEVIEGLTNALQAIGASPIAPNTLSLRAGGLNNRAASLLDLGEQEKARALLREALAVDPSHPEATYNEALLAWRNAEITDEVALARVRNLSTSHQGTEPIYLEALLHLERGDAHSFERLRTKLKSEGVDALQRTEAQASLSSQKSFSTSRNITDSMTINHAETHALLGARDGRIRWVNLSTEKPEETFKVHNEYVMGVALSPDEEIVYSASWDSTLKASSLKTGKTLFSFERPKTHPTALSLSADGTLALTADILGGEVCLFSLKDYELLYSLHDDKTGALCTAFSPAQDLIIAGSEDKNIRFWRISDGVLVKSIKLSSSVYSLCFSPTDEGLLFAGEKNRMVLLDVHTGEMLQVFSGMSSDVRRIAIRADGRLLACDNGHSFQLWELPSGRCLRTVPRGTSTNALRFLRDGDLLALDWNGTLERFRFTPPMRAHIAISTPRQTTELDALWKRHQESLDKGQAAVKKKRYQEALSYAEEARVPGFERARPLLALWESIKLPKVAVRGAWLLEELDEVHASSQVVVNQTEGLAIYARPSGEVCLRDFSSNTVRERWEYPEQAVSRAFALSPNGKEVAVGTLGYLHIESLTKKKRRSLKLSSGAYVKKIAWSKEHIALLDTQGCARVYHAKTLAPVCVVSHQQSWNYGLALTPEALITGDDQGNIFFWNISVAAASSVSEEVEVKKEQPPEAIMHKLQGAPKGKSIFQLQVLGTTLFAAANDGVVRSWDIHTKQAKVSLTGHQHGVPSFALLGDALAATVGFDKSLRLWNLSSGECIGTVPGHSQTLWGVAAQDQHRLLTTCDDGILRRWYVDWALKK